MIEPINYTAALRRSWRLLVALAVVFAVIAVVLPTTKAVGTKDDPTRYQSIAVVGAPPANGIIGSTVTAAQIVFFANGWDVKGAAIKAAKTPGPTLALLGGMSATLQSAKTGASTTATTSASAKAKKNTTGLVELIAEANTANEASTLANAYSGAVNTKVTAEAVAHAAAAAKSGSAAPTTPPITGYETVVPATPENAKKTAKAVTSVTSSRKVRLLGGAVLGLLIGAAIVLVRELLNKKLVKASRAAAHFRYPVIAELQGPPFGAPKGGGIQLPVVTEPASQAAETYRKLRMSVLFEVLAPLVPRGATATDQFANPMFATLGSSVPYTAPTAGSRKIILVVSARDEESRSEVVANLAAVYAEAGQRTVVISTAELDSGVPTAQAAQQSEAVHPEDLRAGLRPTHIQDVSTLSLAPFVRNSGQLVTRAGDVFGAAREVADAVIVEAPGLLAYHHAEALAHSVDVVLVVGEYGTTTFDDADESGDVLRRLGAPVLGVVFTRVPGPKRRPSSSQETALETGAASSGGSAEDPSDAVVPESVLPDAEPGRFPAETQA